MAMLPARYVRLRFLIVNGHVGIGFVNGALRWLLKRFKQVDIILVQEGRDARKWRNSLGSQFAIWPHPRGEEQPMTYVAYRRDRFNVLGVVKRRIDNHGQYPRELDGLILFDTKTGKKYSVSSLHPDPLGKGFDHANVAARQAHIEQVEAYVSWHEESSETCLPFSGGDTNNEVAHETSKGSVREQFAKIGMTPLFLEVAKPGVVDLMELFARFDRDVKAVSRRPVSVPVKGMDHPALYAVVKVRKSN